jgi:hypothetical protein
MQNVKQPEPSMSLDVSGVLRVVEHFRHCLFDLHVLESR